MFVASKGLTKYHISKITLYPASLRYEPFDFIRNPSIIPSRNSLLNPQQSFFGSYLKALHINNLISY